MDELINHNVLTDLWQKIKEREPQQLVVELTKDITNLIKELFKDVIGDLIKTKNISQILPILEKHLPTFFKEFGQKLKDEILKLNKLSDVIMIVINAIIIEFYRVIHQLYEIFSHKLTRSVVVNYIRTHTGKLNPLLQDIKHLPVFGKILDHLSGNKENPTVGDLIMPLVNATITPIEEKVASAKNKYEPFMSKYYNEDWKDEYCHFMLDKDEYHWKDGYKMFMKERYPTWESNYELFKKAQDNKLPYFGNLEKETISNSYYRHVIYTSSTLQLVLMSIKTNESVGMEIHPNNDQLVRIEKGEAKIILGSEGNFEHVLKDGDAVVIPANTYHDIINIGRTDLKIYTVYSPPEHEAGLLEKYKNRYEMKVSRESKLRDSSWEKSIVGSIIKMCKNEEY